MTKKFAAGFAALVITALPAFAAPMTVGENPAADCARAAGAQSRGQLLEGGRSEALAACSQALNGMLASVDRTATLANRGVLEAGGAQASAAIADFDAALKRNPDLADVYVDRGAALLQAARYSEARADFDRAIALHTSNQAVAYFDRGIANEKSGDLPGAYRDYRQAQAASPNFAPAITELARFTVSNNSYARNK